MVHVLVSEQVREKSGALIRRKAHDAGSEVVMHVPRELMGPAGDDLLLRVEAGFVSPDVLGDSSKSHLTPAMATFCDLLDKAPNLSWVQIPASGWDRPQFVAWKERGVTLCNATGVAAVAVAQSAITGMLVLARKVPVWMDAQRRKAWEPLRGDREAEILDGSTAVVVGLGAIGQEIARLCRALRMRVVGVSQSGVDRAGVCDDVYPQADINVALSQCDWLLLSCPLTPETKGLFNATRFSKARHGMRLVDVSRGGVVVEDALLDALQRGVVAEAYLDVTEIEPLPVESALWSHSSVLLSPHYAGDFQGRQDKLSRLFCDNVGLYLQGGKLINAVN